MQGSSDHVQTRCVRHFSSDEADSRRSEYNILIDLRADSHTGPRVCFGHFLHERVSTVTLVYNVNVCCPVNVCLHDGPSEFPQSILVCFVSSVFVSSLPLDSLSRHTHNFDLFCYYFFDSCATIARYLCVFIGPTNDRYAFSSPNADVGLSS